jgi:hypothetical protein
LGMGKFAGADKSFPAWLGSTRRFYGFAASG